MAREVNVENVFSSAWFWAILAINQLYWAVVGYRMAEEFRGNGASGAALGLFFGIWGVPFAFFVEDVRRQCPECMGRVAKPGKRCPHCGEMLPSNELIIKQ